MQLGRTHQAGQVVRQVAAVEVLEGVQVLADPRRHHPALLRLLLLLLLPLGPRRLDHPRDQVVACSEGWGVR